MNIRELCEKYNISQSGLSRRFGIPLRTVQGWYLGERKPPEYVARMIDELLQADEDEDDEDEDDEDQDDYDYSQYLKPDERYRLTKDGPLLTEAEVVEKLRAQYLKKNPGVSELDAKLVALVTFGRMQRERAMMRSRAEAIRQQREARQRMIRTAKEHIPKEEQEKAFFGDDKDE